MFRYPTGGEPRGNVATPISSNDKVFFPSAYGTGAACSPSERRTAKSLEKCYFTQTMKNHHGGVVLVDGYLRFSDAILT